ncbi:hypothetical protein PsAD14_05700 [Pseudovibrio sp. Ad14]|nr:hypothetical protein PsW74_04110 [Pseudovibrio sp. W74]KZL03400.1 hypothetical protein PsAD14_05700 [Pseudovibrio sp. Ad14]
MLVLYITQLVVPTSKISKIAITSKIENNTKSACFLRNRLKNSSQFQRKDSYETLCRYYFS